MSDYVAARTIDEVVGLLATGGWTVVAGGTDYYPGLGDGPARGRVVDVTGIAEARGIHDERDHWRIGALTTWTDIAHAPLPAAFDALKRAAVEVGGVQIQNVATVGGNLCNASPAADGVPPLLALDATVELRGRAGTRTLPVAEFVVGNRQTARADDEMLTAVIVPKPATSATSTFLKLGARRFLVISIVMVAALIEDDGSGHVGRAAVAVGACSPAARRLEALEQALVGRAIDPGLGAAVDAEHLSVLSPIDDVRATAAYRRDAALTLVRRALDRLGGAS